MTPPTLVILGCGFAGTEVARRAIAAGTRVVATTRQSERRAALGALGAEAHVIPALNTEQVGAWVREGAEVLVAFAPDGSTDAEVAPALCAASRIVYVSTTGVYGAHRGRVDEATVVDPREPRARERLDAEARYRDVGAAIVRVAGIYGPGRGLHLRVASGTFRIPGEGTNVVSRIHVADLARLVLGIFERAREGASGVGTGAARRPMAAPGAVSAPDDKENTLPSDIFVAADDTPVPQIEAIDWLCRRLHLPTPPRVPIEEAPATLRHDRAVDNRRIKAWTGISLLYPSYREGFEACLAEERLNPPGFGVPRGETRPGSLPRRR